MMAIVSFSQLEGPSQVFEPLGIGFEGFGFLHLVLELCFVLVKTLLFSLQVAHLDLDLLIPV